MVFAHLEQAWDAALLHESGRNRNTVAHKRRRGDALNSNGSELYLADSSSAAAAAAAEIKTAPAAAYYPQAAAWKNAPAERPKGEELTADYRKFMLKIFDESICPVMVEQHGG